MENQAGSDIAGEGTEKSVLPDGAITVSLRALNSGDAEQARVWRNDYRIWKWCRQNDLISDMQQADWIKAQHANSHIKMYAIEAKTLTTPYTFVGVCGLTDICLNPRRAEFSMYIAPEAQGAGIGRSALQALVRHAFQNLNLHQVWGEVFDGNPALEMFESVGFKKCGRRKEFYYKDGKYIDSHLIEIFREDLKP